MSLVEVNELADLLL